jgi:uncharacterized protein
MPSQDLAIEHDAERHRFTTTVEGRKAYVEYEPGDGRITIAHTIVPASIGGRGIAGELVRAVLDYAKARQLGVHPACSYADAWMRKHPEYEAMRV